MRIARRATTAYACAIFRTIIQIKNAPHASHSAAVAHSPHFGAGSGQRPTAGGAAILGGGASRCAFVLCD